VIVEIGDCRKYCEEGIMESEVCGDSALLAQFTMQLVQLSLHEGDNIMGTLPILTVSYCYINSDDTRTNFSIRV